MVTKVVSSKNRAQKVDPKEQPRTQADVRIQQAQTKSQSGSTLVSTPHTIADKTQPRTPTDQKTVKPEEADIHDHIHEHVETLETVRSYAGLGLKFSKMQKVIGPVTSAMQATPAIAQIETALIGLGGVLGLVLSICSIFKKTRFIATLETIKKGGWKNCTRKEKTAFRKIIRSQAGLDAMLSKEFTTKHNIHSGSFAQLTVEQIDAMIAQTERKRMMDIISAVIFTLSTAIFMGSLIAAPPLWLGFIPLILFIVTYIIDKKMDSNGSCSIIDIITPGFIKDYKGLDRILNFAQSYDLCAYFNPNKAIFAQYLSSNQMEALDKKMKKIKEAIKDQSHEDNIEKLKQEFSEHLKKMLKKRADIDKTGMVGMGIAAGGAGLMLAPLSMLALIIILPAVVIGGFIAWKPHLLHKTSEEKAERPNGSFFETAETHFGIVH